MRIFKLHQRQKRLYQEEYPYSITIVTKDRFPYFENNKIFQKALKINIKLAQRIKQCKIYCYNICSDHCQLIIHQQGQYNISQIVQFIKRNSSQDINKILGYNKFWQINPPPDANAHWRLEEGRWRFGKDKKIKNLKERFAKQCIVADLPKFQWQKSFHHKIIYSERYLERAFNYIIYNRDIHKLRDK